MLAGNNLNKVLFLATSFFLAGFSSNKVSGQISIFDSEKRGSIYFSIGNNTPTHNPSTIRFVQGTPGNVSDYKLDKVKADDKVTSTKSGLPYNIRVGYFFNYNQTFAIELSYDPVKYHIVNGQNVKMTGMLDSRTIDSSFTFSDSTGHFYNLDGANILSVNLVKRFQLFHPHSKVIRVDALAKVGLGPVMPHVYNSIRGKVAEYPSFQLAGWNAGAEAALRLTIMRHLFLEGAYKYSYANYTDIGVYNGTATHKVTTAQVVLSVGYAFSTTKRNPLFTKPEKIVIPFAIRPVFPDAPSPTTDDSKSEKPKRKDVPADETTPSPVPDSPTPAPDAPLPSPEVPSPAPDAPPPAPETPSPAPDAPPPAPEEPKN